MRHASIFSMRLGVLPTLTVMLLALPLQSCLQPTSVDCASGRVCPAGQKCSASGDSCIKTDCGDGIVQANELCDDGNTLNGDGCNSSCSSRETCGNGIVDGQNALDPGKREACDDGNNVDGDGCSANCLSSELCGNSIVDTKVGERCDDGNNIDSDGCSANCLSNELCGNNYLDIAKGEKCDDGNNENGDGCSGDCRSDEKCGNGITDVAVGEVCDDHNNESGDGCSANCKSNETCGNGIKDVAIGEYCDDGNQADGDACSADCKGPGVACGNGKLDPGEECDDGNQVDEDDCLKTCKVNVCGDGVVDTKLPHIEKCDTGGESATCNINCTKPTCGDGIVNAHAGETCDDGNRLACGTCNETCTQWQDIKAATGSIIALPQEAINDGEKIYINDGTRTLVFEFDKANNGCSGNTRCVKIQDQKEPDEVANVLAEKIKNSNFDIQVASILWNVVKLQHKAKGSIGNQPITHTVAHWLFKVEGMDGGSGEGCGDGTSCRLDMDCAYGLQCEEGRCKSWW